MQLWHDIMFHFKLYINLIILDTKGKFLIGYLHPFWHFITVLTKKL